MAFKLTRSVATVGSALMLAVRNGSPTIVEASPMVKSTNAPTVAVVETLVKPPEALAPDTSVVAPPPVAITGALPDAYPVMT